MGLTGRLQGTADLSKPQYAVSGRTSLLPTKRNYFQRTQPRHHGPKVSNHQVAEPQPPSPVLCLVPWEASSLQRCPLFTLIPAENALVESCLDLRPADVGWLGRWIELWDDLLKLPKDSHCKELGRSSQGTRVV